MVASGSRELDVRATVDGGDLRYYPLPYLLYFEPCRCLTDSAEK